MLGVGFASPVGAATGALWFRSPVVQAGNVVPVIVGFRSALGIVNRTNLTIEYQIFGFSLKHCLSVDFRHFETDGHLFAEVAPTVTLL